jgi:hypothetical protein
VAEYGAAFRQQVIREVATLPEHSNTEEMLADYSVLRAQLRACR